MIERINLVTEHELNTIDDINRKCLELHMMPPIKAELGIDLFDKNGKHKKEYKTLSKSWVRNFYNWMFSQMTGVFSGINDETTFGPGTLVVKNTDGTNKYCSSLKFATAAMTGQTEKYGSEISAYVGSAGETTKGIVAGIGTDAEDFNSYKLQSLITNGSSSGQLSYAAQEATTMSYDSITKIMKATLVRYLNNNSGELINVGEIGWITKMSIAYNTGTFLILVSRDLISPTVAVADGDQLKVTYTISMQFPA